MNDDYIAYKRNSEIWNMGHYHFHEQYEILLSMSDNAEMFVTDRCYPMQYGTLFLMKPAVLHRSVSHNKQQYKRYVLRFSKHYVAAQSSPATDLLRCFAMDRVQFQLTGEQTARLEKLYQKCIESPVGYGSDLRRQMNYTALMIYVNEITASLSGCSAETAGNLRSNISDILNYIPNHLSDDLSLNALAARFYISKPHLCRMFKEYTGFSPGEYIIKSRIIRARNLLQEGKSVQDACTESGFHSYAHFIRTFRQLVGVSPGKYKNRDGVLMD